MSLRSTKSRIQGKIAAGGFKQPDNTLAKAIDTGAGIMAQGIMRQAEEERQEKREAKKAAAAEARRLAAAQAKKEEEARKNQRIATSIATRFGIEPTNTVAMAYVMNEVEIHGTDALGVVQKDFEDRNANLTTVEVTEEYVTGARPDRAPPMRLSPNPDGSMRTTLDIGEALDDLEATDSPAASAARSSAEKRFSPQQLDKGEVQTATTTSQGFEFNPLAKKNKIDWASVKSPAEVENIRRLHKAGQQVLSAEDLKVLELYESDFDAAEALETTAANREFNQQIIRENIDGLRSILNSPDTVYDQDQKAIAQAELDNKLGIAQKQKDEDAAAKALEFRRSLVGKDAEYLRGVGASGDFSPEEKAEAAAQLAALPGEPFNITDYDDIKDPTLQTIIANPKTDPEKVTALEALLSNRRNTAPKVNVDSPDYIVTYIDEAGQKQVTVAKLADGGGGFVDLTTSTPVVPAPDTAPINMELQSTLASDLAKINTPLIKPLKAARSSMVSTLRSAKKLDDLVNPVTGNPEILTTIGSVGPTILKRIGLEGKAAFDLIAGAGNTTQGLSLLDQRFATYINESNLTGSARAAALFQAEKVKMAFMFAASALGQSGQGLSDKDFLRALKILDSGSDYKTFSENLRSQTLSVIEATDVEINQFNTDGAVKILNTIDVSGQVMAGYKQTAEEFAVSNNLGDAFAWAKSEVGTPAPNSSPPTANPPTLEEFIEKAREMNVGTSDADLEAFWAKKYGGSN
jgi:hypothetical protein